MRVEQLGQAVTHSSLSQTPLRSARLQPTFWLPSEIIPASSSSIQSSQLFSLGKLYTSLTEKPFPAIMTRDPSLIVDPSRTSFTALLASASQLPSLAECGQHAAVNEYFRPITAGCVIALDGEARPYRIMLDLRGQQTQNSTVIFFLLCKIVTSQRKPKIKENLNVALTPQKRRCQENHRKMKEKYFENCVEEVQVRKEEIQI